MGYDCTLHLIDEKAIRDEFVPRLLGQTSRETAMDRVITNSEELWDAAGQSLRDDEPADAAAHICQLAVCFSACSLPHHYERGFALSLWQDQREDRAVQYPVEFAYSPESLFAAVVKEHPRLRGRFPRWFEGNGTTGVFIPSDRVAHMLRWVEERLALMTKGNRRHFKGLLAILRAAAEHGLAYWEATDLAIPSDGQFPGDPKLMMARYLGTDSKAQGAKVEEAAIEGHYSRLGTAMHDEWLVSGDYSPFETSFWNLSSWPPRLVHTLPEFAANLSRSHDGRWLLFSETDSAASSRSFRPRIFSDLNKAPEADHPVIVDGTPFTVWDGGFVGNRLIVFRDAPYTTKAGDLLPPPLWLEGTAWQPVPSLPDRVAKSSDFSDSIEQPVVGTIRLADGKDVVLWDGDGYEWRDGRFEKTFTMEAKTSDNKWTCVPAGNDGFFYLSNRCLFEVHRHGTPIAHAPLWQNIMSISRGPEGTLLLKEGENDDGDAGKLYFPEDGTFIHIEPDLFDGRNYPFIHWSEPTDRFIVMAGKFLSVRTAAVLSLPLHWASDGREVKPSLGD